MNFDPAFRAFPLVTVGLVFFGLHASSAAEPSVDPVLRIEAGTHTDIIKRIATDVTGRLVLTVSDDKTARLWSMGSNNGGASMNPVMNAGCTLLRVFRPPIGAGFEGRLYCGALSPDGALAAVGGWTGYEWDRKYTVYVFDTATGNLLNRLETVPSSIFDVSFSSSGRWLAGGIGVGGIRVWELPSGRLVGEDSEYDDLCLGLDWHQDERLASTCLDGTIRLYEFDSEIGPGDGIDKKPVQLSPVARRVVPREKAPYSIRFSPDQDGKSLALGFHDSSKIEVIDGKTLDLQFFPETSGFGVEGLPAVDWSFDGSVLAAAGRQIDLKGTSPICFWSQAGRGSFQQSHKSGNGFPDLRRLPSGGFVFAAADPSWGFLSSDGEILTLKESPVADHLGAQTDARLSADATAVMFAFSKDGQSLSRFSIKERQLTAAVDPELQVGFRPPRTMGLPITGWKIDGNPKLDGVPLGLSSHERSRSLVVSSDNSFFILGTEWRLRCYDAKGGARWKGDSPGAVISVNLSSDNRVVVAAYGDGTIRWHRCDTGEELLAFFPHADRKRWVLWTPQGYYDCSTGAEELIGWHVNRGKDEAADFFPAAKFREQFYRPDVIDRVLETLEVSLAVKAADEAAGRKATEVNVAEVVARMQPPIVELAVGGGAGEAEIDGETFLLRYRVRTASAEPVTRLRVLIDGRPVTVTVPVPPDSSTEETASVPVPQRDCILSLIAENRFAVSEPAAIRLTRAATPTPAPVETIPDTLKPKLYLLAVGVNDYEKNEHLSDLNYAAKDATDFSAAFQGQEGGLYQKVEGRVLTDAGATAGDVLDGLDWIRKETTAKDVAVVFFAGHGENDEELRYYFCPSDYDPDRRLRTGVAMEEIQKTLASIPGKVLFFIDTCHAGNALGKLFASRGSGGGPDINRLVNELSSAENGAIVFASSTGRQESVESDEWQNGAFTKAIVEGLGGQADLLKNGKITVATLESWVAERVKELSGGIQTPTVAKPQTVPDFPIAVKR